MKRYVPLLILVFGIVGSAGTHETSSNTNGQQQRPFTGFVPDETTAVKVARPMIRAMEGAKYLERYEPLVARKVLGRWVVSGLAHASTTSDYNLEPVKMALDPLSGRVVAYGVLTDARMRDILKRVKPNRIPEHSRP